METLQIAALLYLIVYIGLIIVFRGILLYKRTGINPLKSKKKTGIDGVVAKIFAVCIVLMFTSVLNFVFIENNYKYLLPIELLQTNLISTIGIALSFIGLAIGFYSQLQMGDSWRLALNEKEKIQLIDHGIFAYSRNPIYLGYLISLIGFFMMMPNVISLLLLILSYISIEVKIRLEENYLKKNSGIEYEEYFGRVRRWI